MRMRFEKLSRKNVRQMTKIALLCFGRAYVNGQVKVWLAKKLDGDYDSINDVLEYFLVSNGKKPVGISGFYKIKKEKVFWLGYFAIIKPERRKGLGSQMLQQTLTKAKTFGCGKFGAWTNSKKASKFYERNGFKKGKNYAVIIVDGKVIYRYPKNSVFYYKKC
ncbi:MAG: GNAT family N-acetyltransferase [Candidatus Aenigmarchaeota archaeon]|nr:GNAT family N-acetyltransferase [Candidatus Aenigmarchaeota archaeon]